VDAVGVLLARTHPSLPDDHATTLAFTALSVVAKAVDGNFTSIRPWFYKDTCLLRVALSPLRFERRYTCTEVAIMISSHPA
jgi:hypothetical protein